MTIIAWDGKTLAADRRVCYNDEIFVTTKIFKNNLGIFGVAGEGVFCYEVLSWIKKNRVIKNWPKKLNKEDFAVILFITNKKEILFYADCPLCDKLEVPFVAIGSGAQYARAAMFLGKTAKEAVEVACMFDPYCGNGIDYLKVT